METLNGKQVIGPNTRPFIKHYIKQYGFVPLWVLSNDLTFGNIAHFYQLCERRVQNKVCKLIVESKNDTDAPRLSPQDLRRCFSVLVGFRNLCAHDERLYCAVIGTSGNESYAKMASCLKKILLKSSFKKFTAEVLETYNKFKTDLCAYTVDTLLQEMGFAIKHNKESKEN